MEHGADATRFAVCGTFTAAVIWHKPVATSYLIIVAKIASKSSPFGTCLATFGAYHYYPDS